jgi:hypothetical protein
VLGNVGNFRSIGRHSSVRGLEQTRKAGGNQEKKKDVILQIDRQEQLLQGKSNRRCDREKIDGTGAWISLHVPISSAQHSHGVSVAKARNGLATGPRPRRCTMQLQEQEVADNALRPVVAKTVCAVGGQMQFDWLGSGGP